MAVLISINITFFIKLFKGNNVGYIPTSTFTKVNV